MSIGPGAYETELEALQNAPSGEAVEILDQALGYAHALDHVGGVGLETSLTVAAGFSNAVGLLLASVVILYALFVGILKTASEGKVLGQRWSSVTLPLSAAAALGLIIPTPLAGGYISSAQAIVTKIAILGSNAADYVWSATVDVATVRPSVYVTSVEGRIVAATMLRALTCEYTLAQFDKREPIFLEYSTTKSRGVQIGKDGACGSVNLPIFDESYSSILKNANDVLLARAKNEAMKAAIDVTMQLVRDLKPIAYLIVHPSAEVPHSWDLVVGFDDDERNDKILEPYYRKFEVLADSFSKDIHAAIYEAYVSSNDGVAEEYRDYLKSLGWFRAGTAFRVLSSMQREASELVQIVQGAVSSPQISALREFWASGDKYLLMPVNFVDVFVAKALRGKRSERVDYVSGANRIADLDVSSICGKDWCDERAAFREVGRWSASLLVARDEGGDLVSWSTGLGHRLTGAAASMWFIESGIKAARGVADGTGKSVIGLVGAAVATSPLAEVLGHVAEATKDFRWAFLAAGTMLTVSGSVPAVLWLFAALGWFVQVVRLVVAAPLAFVVRFDPDDPKFLGGISNRWYMVIFSVAVTPMLMIVAFWLSVALSIIAYPLVSEYVLASVSSELANPFSVFGSALVVALASFTLSLYIFGLPLSLPSAVMEMVSPGSAGDGGGVNMHETLSIEQKGKDQLKEVTRNVVGGGGGGPRPPSGGMA